MSRLTPRLAGALAARWIGRVGPIDRSRQPPEQWPPKQRRAQSPCDDGVVCSCALPRERRRPLVDSADSVAHPTVKRAIEHDRCTVLRPIAANRPFPLADAEVGIKQADIWHDCYILPRIGSRLVDHGRSKQAHWPNARDLGTRDCSCDDNCFLAAASRRQYRAETHLSFSRNIPDALGARVGGGGGL